MAWLQAANVALCLMRNAFVSWSAVLRVRRVLALGEMRVVKRPEGRAPAPIWWMLLLFCVVVGAPGNSVWAAMPGFRWVVNSGGTDDDLGNGVAVDGDGNTIVTGLFSQVADVGGKTLTSRGLSDIVVASYDSGGKLRWAQPAGGPGMDEGRAVAVDRQGNVFWAGTFAENASFSGWNFQAVGDLDFVVGKYSVGGTALWTEHFGGPGADHVYSVAVDLVGNCYVTGSFSGTLRAGATNLESKGGTDIFLIKLDVDGKTVWGRSAGGALADEGYGVGTGPEGEVYWVGVFREQMEFQGKVVTSSGGGDCLVAQLDRTGAVRWIRGAGGPDPARPDRANRVKVDRMGNCYVVGSYSGEAMFDDVRLISRGGYDVFAAKYDALGKLIWVRSGGGPGDDRGDDLGVDGAGNVYVAGLIMNGAVFERFAFSTGGNSDAMVVKYDPNGNLGWAFQSGATGYTTGLGLGVNSSGAVSVTGYFRGATPLGEFWMENNGGRNMYIARVQGPPQLSIRSDGGTVRLSWPRAAGAYWLEETGEVNTSGAWIRSGRLVERVGDENAVTRENRDGVRFFRLRK